MDFKKTAALLLFILFFTFTATASAFPPQSIEFLPGYTAPDSASDGGPAVDLRYLLHFPSLYFAAGIGVGQINVPANHRNLAIGSDLEMTPVGFTLRLSPPLFESFVTFVEIGADRLFGLHYELDPSVNTGENDICIVDPTGIGPTPCRKTTIKENSVAYRFGAGIEKGLPVGFRHRPSLYLSEGGATSTGGQRDAGARRDSHPDDTGRPLQNQTVHPFNPDQLPFPVRDDPINNKNYFEKRGPGRLSPVRPPGRCMHHPYIDFRPQEICLPAGRESCYDLPPIRE
ncbi:MAG: hypothetical protein MPW15_24990 [Candidatus Manganitrophus sp.]|nr:hypothetical protein [Candidatus Manganitrophus sp.]